MRVRRIFSSPLSNKKIFGVILTILLTLLASYHLLSGQNDEATPDSGYNSVKENLTRLKELNLLSDSDPLRFNIPGSECTLDYINKKKLQQNHPCVIEIIRRLYLHPPADRDVPYRLGDPSIPDPSEGQAAFIREHLKNMTNGFFIECGANDGEFLSNTLFMERFQNWNGLLIEADNNAFANLVAIRRKAYALPVCLSLVPYPNKVFFNTLFDTENRGEGTILTDNSSLSYVINKPKIEGKKISSQCFPLYSILLAVKQTHIDFFSLDVEGYEPAILKTIPWDKVDFKTMVIEWKFLSKEAIMNIISPYGYYVFQEDAFSDDLLIARNSTKRG